MAIIQTLRDLFFFSAPDRPETIRPAPPTSYSIKPVTANDLTELLRLNLRCFVNGDNYSVQTFRYLLNEPHSLSYQVRTAEGVLAGFVFVVVNADGAAHITTICSAPEHRRRGIARLLLEHIERALRAKGLSTIVLEVRIGNEPAQELYSSSGYSIVQRMRRYYNNGEDGFLMMKSLT